MSQFQIDGFAFITGGAGGIGREVGLTFAEAGARGVFFCDVDAGVASVAAEKSKELTTSPSYITAASGIDVTEPASIEQAVENAVKAFGRIDYCINAHGITVPSFVPYVDTSVDIYDSVVDVNARGAFLVSQAVTKIMQSQNPVVKDFGRRGRRDLGRGCIVNIGSANSHAVSAAKLPYVVSKHAVLGVTRCCAEDGKSIGVRVNQISPSWVRTPMFDQDCRMEPATPQVVEAIMAPKRVIEPDEVASAALYLCSPSAVYINGISLVMDAGLTLGPALIRA